MLSVLNSPQQRRSWDPWPWDEHKWKISASLLHIPMHTYDCEKKKMKFKFCKQPINFASAWWELWLWGLGGPGRKSFISWKSFCFLPFPKPTYPPTLPKGSKAPETAPRTSGLENKMNLGKEGRWEEWNGIIHSWSIPGRSRVRITGAISEQNTWGRINIASVQITII